MSSPNTVAAATQGVDPEYKNELATLRVMRASLESLKQFIQEVGKDVDTATENLEGVAGKLIQRKKNILHGDGCADLPPALAKRWQAALEGASQLEALEKKEKVKEKEKVGV